MFARMFNNTAVRSVAPLAEHAIPSASVSVNSTQAMQRAFGGIGQNRRYSADGVIGNAESYAFSSFMPAAVFGASEQAWVKQLGFVGNRVRQLLLEGDNLDIHQAFEYLEGLKSGNGLASITPQASSLLQKLTEKVHELAAQQGVELVPTQKFNPRPGAPGTGLSR